MERRANWPSRALTWWVLFLCYLTVTCFSALNDLRSVFLCSGELFLQHRNPYDLTLFGECAYGVLTGSSPALGFSYPPTIFPLLLPFISLPEGAIVPVWNIVNSAALASAVVLSLFSSVASRRALVVGLLFMPTLYGLTLGHPTPLFLLALVVLIRWRAFGDTRYRYLAGILFALFLAKPHPIWLAAVFILWDACVNRNWRFLLGALIGSIAIVGLPFVLYPTIYAEFFGREIEALLNWYTPTLPTLLVELGSPQVPAIVGSFFAALVIGGAQWVRMSGAANRFDSEPDEDREQGMIYGFVALSLISVPYAWPYDYLLLLPGFKWIWNERVTRRYENLIIAILGLFLVSTFRTPVPQIGDILCPALIWGMLAYQLRQRDPIIGK